MQIFILNVLTSLPLKTNSTFICLVHTILANTLYFHYSSLIQSCPHVVSLAGSTRDFHLTFFSETSCMSCLQDS